MIDRKGPINLRHDRSAEPLREVGDEAVERAQARVVGLGDVDAELLVDRDHEVEDVHRVEVELVAEVDVPLDLRRVGLQRDLAQHAEDGGPDLVGGHRSSGSWSSRSRAVRNALARWPSVTRWSAASVAVTTGHGRSCPPEIHGRSTSRPKPTIATCGGKMIGRTVSAPRSPRLVTVIVGSESSELRSDPARARETRSRKPGITSSRLSYSAWCSAGATRPPPRRKIAMPRCTPSLP